MFKYCLPTIFALLVASCSGGDTQDDNDDTTTDATAEVIIIADDADSGGDSVAEDVVEDTAEDPMTEPDVAPDVVEDTAPEAVEEVAEDSAGEETDSGEHQDDPDVTPDPDVASDPDVADEVEDIADEPDLRPTFGLVSVLVEDGRFPAPDIAVVFSDEDGGVLLSTVTNEEGIASHEMDAGGSITVATVTASGRSDSYSLRTLFGVQPFDEYHLVLPAFGVTRDPIIGKTDNLVHTPDAIFNEATHYHFDNGCRTVSIESPIAGPVDLDVFGSCATEDSQRDVAVWALKEGAVIGSVAVHDQPAGPDSEVVTTNAEAWTVGAPSVVISLLNSSYALTILDILNTAWVDGMDYLGVDGSIVTAATNLEVAGSVNLPIVAGLGDFYENWVTLGYGLTDDDLGLGYLRIDQIDHTLNREPVWDLSGLIPPRMYDVAVTTSNDRERVEVTWSVEGAPANLVAEGRLTWSDSDGVSYNWLFLGPVESETVVELPTIPLSLSGWLPSGEASIQSTIQAWITPTLTYNELRTFIDLMRLSSYMLHGRSTPGFARTPLGEEDLFIIRSTSVNPI